MNNPVSAVDDYKGRVLRLENENKHLRRSLEELSILNELASTIGGLGSSQSILTQIVRYSIMAVGAEQGVITLINGDAENRRKTAVRVVDPSTEGEPHHLHESILVWMCRNKQPLLMNDPHHDPRFQEARWDKSISSFLCAPLMIQGALIGVLKVYNKRGSSGFTVEDQRLLAIVASQSAQVIESARITEREHTMAITHVERERQLQQEFSEKLITLLEQGRKQIAGELHDSIGQNLLVIKNRAYLAMESCPENHPAVKELQTISSISMQTIDEVREIAYRLHPYKLERLGLTKAIRSIVDSVSESTTMKISSDIDAIDGLVPKNSEIHLYRIVQEGLNNVIRHAHAKSVTLSIARKPAAVTISMQDDGCGFDVDELRNIANEERGFGLRGMEERVRICGGEFTLCSTPGKGTTFTISIPYERNCNGE